jgi:Ran-binding protein 3
MSHSVKDDVTTTNDDPPPFTSQESDPEGGADDFEVFPEDKENAVVSIQQGDAAGEIEITQSSVSSSVSSCQDAEHDASETHDAALGLPPARRPSDSDSGESEKVLKRKLADRGTSQGPENLVPMPSAEPAKRPRDDANKDDNPRESKRPSPPPEQKPAVAETSAPKFVCHCLLFKRLC